MKRFVAFLVCFSIVITLFLPFASAATVTPDYEGSLIRNIFDLTKTGKVSYAVLQRQRKLMEMGNSIMDYGANVSGLGSYLDSFDLRKGPFTIEWTTEIATDYGGAWVVWDANALHPGGGRGWIAALGADPSKDFSWAPPDNDHPAPTGAVGATSSDALNSSGNTWTPVPYLQKNIQLTSLGRLSARRDEFLAKDGYKDVRISDITIGGTKYWALLRSTNSGVLAYTDYRANAFCAPVEEKSTVTNVKFDYTKVESDNGSVSIAGDNSGDISTGDQVLDLSGGTFGGFHGDVTFNEGDTHIHNEHLIEAIWNGDYKRYEITTGDFVFNTDNRKFEQVTNNYYVTYNITNTYIQYIGSSAEFTPTAYELYYELPDGRSSADLTADEVGALSFQFYDCMNYERAATDSNMRALYHFDGDLSDSSFFSDKSSVTWKKGGSITYMDSSTFDGALYLDERSHELEFVLPSGIRGGSDFTIQFRHYQASQPDTQDNRENSLSLGGVKLMSWDERNLYLQATASLVCQLPIGNWAELAVVRSNGIIYLYVNGVSVASFSNSSGFTRQLTFALGNTSRAYTMLDELRVLDFAVADGGANYTPTAVPYDSNLVLVLPGDGGVVSSWFEFFEDSPQVVKNANFTVDGFSLVKPSSSSTAPLGTWVYSPLSSYSPDSAFVDNGFVSLYSSSSSNCKHDYTDSSGFFCLVANKRSNSGAGEYLTGFEGLNPSVNISATKTFVVVLADGTLCTLTFDTLTSSSKSFSWGKLEYRYARYSNSLRAALFIVPSAGKAVDVVYAGLVNGADWSFGWNYTQHTAALDASALQANTAAVQTDIPITGYTVGGVRPTFPQRGNVWFGVTSGRISSVQVYTGSAWTSVNARWWTGSRWIPIYAFDIYTLADCWDIADGDDLITPITTETEGWNWWKGAWNDFRKWLGGVFTGTDQSPAETAAPVPVTTTFTLLGSDQAPVLKNLNVSTAKTGWGAGLNVKMGTSDYFTVHYSEKSKMSSALHKWTDGYSVGYVGDGSASRFDFQGTLGGGHVGQVYNSIEFSTKYPATVTVWSYIQTDPDKVDPCVIIQDSSFDQIGGPLSSELAVFNLDSPGTFYLGSFARPCYIYKVEVVEYGSRLIDTPPVDTTQDYYLSTHVLLGSHQSANQILLDRISDLTAQGKKVNLQYNKDSGDGYEAWGGGVRASMGTGNYFTVRYSAKSKVDFNPKNWSDGFSAGSDFARFNFGGSLDTNFYQCIQFTTSGPCVVKVWWVPAADGRRLWVADSHLRECASTPSDKAKKNEPLFSVLQVSEPGTLYLGGKSNPSYIYKVEVVEVVYRDPPPTIGTNPGDNYDDGQPDILDDPLQDDDGQDVSIFGLAGWLTKGLWNVVKGLFDTVLGGVTGIFKLIFDGTGSFFDAFNDDLNPYSFSTYGGSDIWE